MTRTRIVSKSSPSREGRGNTPDINARSPVPAITSSGVNPVPTTDEAAVARFWTKRTLCEWLQISTRSWDRATAAGLTPQPDLVVGREARFSPLTITKWLRTRPKLPGRGGQRS